MEDVSPRYLLPPLSWPRSTYVFIPVSGSVKQGGPDQRHLLGLLLLLLGQSRGSMAGQETACGSANSGQVVQFSFCQWANYKLQKPWMAPGQRQDLNPSPVGGEWARLPAV